jgi:hypothetical protein
MRLFRTLSIISLVSSFAALVAPVFNEYESKISILLPSLGIVTNFDLKNLQLYFMFLGWIFFALGYDREQPTPEPEIIQLNLD